MGEAISKIISLLVVGLIVFAVVYEMTRGDGKK